MTAVSDFRARVQRAFEPNGRGVVGVADEIFTLCGVQGLRLDWQEDRCRVRTLGAEPQESTDVPLPKSAFRAILARVAALCNERTPDSVSPYGGAGELLASTDPASVFHVSFANRPDEQRLELRRINS